MRIFGLILFTLSILTSCGNKSNAPKKEKESLSSQVSKVENPESILKLLSDQIIQINNSESFLNFLINHAATYKDFDSLYSIIEGVPCPDNFTYNLINGDRNKTVKVSKAFLYLIQRNFGSQDFNLDESNLRSYNDFVRAINGNIKDPYTNFYDSHKKISSEIKNKIRFNIDAIEIKSQAYYAKKNQYLYVRSNAKAWGKLDEINAEELFTMKDNTDFLIKDGLIIFSVRENSNDEKNFYNQISNQDEDFLKNDMGGSLIAENISHYISAQVFNDIGFFEVNGKIIWIDMGR